MKSEFGITLCDSDIPIPFIYSAIIPRHLSFSMSEASFPKARVNGPCFVCVCAFNWSLVLIVFVLESFFCFFFLKVFLSFACFQTDYFVLLSLNKSSNKRLNFNNHEQIILNFFNLIKTSIKLLNLINRIFRLLQ